MLSIQIASEPGTANNVSLLRRLLLLVTRSAAMGMLPMDTLTRLDAEAVRRVIGALQKEKLLSAASLDLEPLLRLGPSALDPAEAGRMEAVVERIIETLGESPSPANEWHTMREVFGDADLSRLVCVSESSLRRYAAAARATPQVVAERLHWLAMAVADLAGAYNDFGIRRWFERPRTQLAGRSPRQSLGDEWTVDSEAAVRLRTLAQALVGAQPLAA